MERNIDISNEKSTSIKTNTCTDNMKTKNPPYCSQHRTRTHRPRIAPQYNDTKKHLARLGKQHKNETVEAV